MNCSYRSPFKNLKCLSVAYKIKFNNLCLQKSLQPSHNSAFQIHPLRLHWHMLLNSLIPKYFFLVIRILEPVTKKQTQDEKKRVAMKNIHILQQSTSPVTRKFLQPGRTCPHAGQHQSALAVLSTSHVYEK